MPKTVFVLGAGASHGLGFPLGNGLKRELLAHLKTGNTVFGALTSSGFLPEQLLRFTRTLARAEFDTIDDHLREINDPETREIGKRAVAYVIRMMENDDRLFHTDDQPKHWYKSLANHLKRHRVRASSADISFITYNYDRSLSHYLFETLLARQFPQDALKVFLGEANVHHVHGHVGELPWQFSKESSRPSYHQYGAFLSNTDLGVHVPRIMHPDDARAESLVIARLVGQATVIVFVGFGFHPSNLKLLPFAIASSATPMSRYHFSINPLPPPKSLLIDGRPIVHFKGPAEEMMEKFFSDLESGKLIEDINAPYRPKRIGRTRVLR